MSVGEVLLVVALVAVMAVVAALAVLVARLSRVVTQVGADLQEQRQERDRQRTSAVGVEVAEPGASYEDSSDDSVETTPDRPRQWSQQARPAESARARGGDAADDVRIITAIDHEGNADDPSMIRVASVAFAGPLLKAAALSYGVRHALAEDQRMRVGFAVRRELKRQRKLRRRRRSQQAASTRWRS